jgi:hypothetical protein
VPDENSNLNSPAPARRPGASRRRGRRGGRGRDPRPIIAKPGEPDPEKISPAPEAAELIAPPAEHVEREADSSGDFREPHAEAPADFAAHEANPVESPLTQTAAENFPALQSEPQHERRPERRSEPLRPKPWVKPADFRPAETSAISQAVAHATEIAESLKQMIDELDEVLELVEVAERQKLADEREIDELRRALRRIQPPRREPPPFRPPPRRDEPRAQREPIQRPEESHPTQEPEEPPGQTD